MNDDKRDESETEAPTPPMRPGRRGFLRGAGAALGGTVLATTGLVGCGEDQPPSTPGAGGGEDDPPTEPAGERRSAEVPPGQLDAYYGFWSGGQSGEVRVLGIPSMRELKRIPVFNRDSATGWGATDWSKQALGGRASGDTHHVHLSYNEGTYDGRYAYVNDKAAARLARVRLDTFEVDAIVDIPNSFGTHGIFPQRHRTGLVMCNSEFRAPITADANPADVSTYAALHTAIDGESMEVQWQVMVEGNLDLCATDYQGRYSFACSYNLEGGATLEEMMANDQDCVYVFDVEAIGRAVAAGNGVIRLPGSEAPVLDARGENGPYVLRVPVPKSPHGVNISPDGRYAVAAGKLSPTVSVIEIAKLGDAFAGRIQPRDCVVAEPEVGLGPLHTAFDGRGNAYTSIFIDSVVTKWNIAQAIEAFGEEDSDVDPIIQKLDVHYQIGHINASMSETNEADGQWLIALCKFSKDRYLSVGLLHPENDQLIDISGERMVLVHDGSTYPEPHDAVIVARDKINAVKIDPRDHPRYELFQRWAQEDGVNLQQDNRVVRRGEREVRVYMTSRAPNFGMTDFHVQVGDQVTVIVSNQDNVEDLSHGFCMTNHDVNFLVNAQSTESMTFTAESAGVFWYYCPWFCHALHLEMRGRMFVDAR